jgi:hypothetical protein
VSESPRFIAVEVEPTAGCEDGLSLRFKRAGAETELTTLRYESERGTEGLWSVASLDDAAGTSRSVARAAQVDDSSAGVVWLVYGGAYGLELTHPEGEVERVPYLVLARIETA